VWNGQACVAQNTTPPPDNTKPPENPTNPQTPIPVNNGGPKATPLDAASSGAATQALDVLAKQSAPGAKAVPGTVLAGNFQQGQTLETTFQAQPGKCYTIVGAGLPAVTNLDLQIVTPSPLPGLGSPILATDQTSSPNAVVGAAPNCWKWALPAGAPLKMVMTVSAGQGIAAAQIYEK